jgi:hypothetical protein
MTKSRPIEGTQSDRFRDMAKQLECDEDEAAFKAKLAVIARQKPKGEPKNPQKPKT